MAGGRSRARAACCASGLSLRQVLRRIVYMQFSQMRLGLAQISRHIGLLLGQTCQLLDARLHSLNDWIGFCIIDS